MTLGGRTVSSSCVAQDAMMAHQKGHRKKEGVEGAADGSEGKWREGKGEPIKFQAPYTHSSALPVTPQTCDLIPL